MCPPSPDTPRQEEIEMRSLTDTEKREKEEEAMKFQIATKDQEDRIISAYKQYLTNLKITDEEKKTWEEGINKIPPELRFSSQDDASKFFKDMAAQKVPFLAYHVDKEGKPTGEYKFSDGEDGKCYERTLDPNIITSLRDNMNAIEGNETLRKELYNLLKKDNSKDIEKGIEDIIRRSKPDISRDMKQEMTNMRSSGQSLQQSVKEHSEPPTPTP